MNLLNLDNDVLNIIGGYVKQDNNIREFNELIKKEIFDYVDNEIKKINKKMSHFWFSILPSRNF